MGAFMHCFPQSVWFVSLRTPRSLNSWEGNDSCYNLQESAFTQWILWTRMPWPEALVGDGQNHSQYALDNYPSLTDSSRQPGGRGDRWGWDKHGPSRGWQLPGVRPASVTQPQWEKLADVSGPDGVVGREVWKEGAYVYPRLIHVEVWQKPTKHCKAIILQLKINSFFKKASGLGSAHHIAEHDWEANKKNLVLPS